MSPSKTTVLLNEETLEAFPLKSWEKRVLTIELVLFNISLGILDKQIGQKRKMSVIRSGKEEKTPLLCTNRIVLHLKI
jgi:hypothetical protein